MGRGRLYRQGTLGRETCPSISLRREICPSISSVSSENDIATIDVVEKAIVVV